MSQMDSEARVVLFDLDDTLINTKDAIYHHLRGKGVPIRHWSLWGSFNIEEHAAIEQEEFRQMCNRERVFMDIQPFLFATRILKDLRQQGYHVLIVTAREGFMDNPVDDTLEYLEHHDFEYDDLIITVSGGNKVPYLTEYDHIELSLDDQVKNCHDFAHSAKIDNVLLAAEAHNKNCTLYPRLHTLYQVYNYLGID